MKTTETTIFVIDDDPDMRHSLKWLLESVDLPVQLFASAEEFLSRCDLNQPGCLLVDVRMPGLGGLGLLKHLQTIDCRLPAIVFTGYGDVPMAVQALKLGALDFIEKPAPPQQILDRLQEAVQLNQERWERHRERVRIRELWRQLTPREQEVLSHLVAGDGNKAIADALGISERTVEKHRESLLRKTGTHSLAGLMRVMIHYQDDA